MRRVLLAAVALTALTLTVPAAALAGHARHHHKRRAHHARVHFVHLSATSSGTTGLGTATGITPPTAPAIPSTENAGTVASYTGGVLTLTLNDKSSVSGKVTSGTQIECVVATPAPPTTGEGDEGSGEDQSQGDHNQQQEGGQDGQDSGDDEAGQATSEPPCDSSALSTGAIVREAELRIGPSGTEFESIVLFR